MILRGLPYFVVLIFITDFFLQTISGDDVAEGVKIPCPPGWFYFGVSCYLVGGNDKELNWNQSVEHCTSVGAKLATVSFKGENDFLVSLLLMEIKKSAWIGLNDHEEEGNYKWQSGSRSKYRNWREGEPTGDIQSEAECVELLADLYTDDVGTWNDVYCDDLKGYICEKQSDFFPNFPNRRFCTFDKGGGFRFLESCYHLVMIMNTWEEAEKYCVDHYRGHLVTVLDKSVDFYLNYILPTEETEVWIGIKTREQYQQKWTSGWYVGYSGFGTYYSNLSEGNCVSRRQLKMWNIGSCEKSLPFICEKSYAKVPTLKPPVEGSYCPSSCYKWIDLGGEMCYSIETTFKTPWHFAQHHCQEKGGNLLTIHSEEEEQVLLPFIRYVTRSVYIGLFVERGGKNYRWVDGSIMDYENWGSSKLIQKYPVCVEARDHNMEWDVTDCDHAKAHICAIKKITPSSITASIVTCESDGNNSGALIGVIISIVINIILIGVVIYYCRKKTISDVIGLQPSITEVPRRTLMPAEMSVMEEVTYYEPME